MSDVNDRPYKRDICDEHSLNSLSTCQICFIRVGSCWNCPLCTVVARFVYVWIVGQWPVVHDIGLQHQLPSECIRFRYFCRFSELPVHCLKDRNFLYTLLRILIHASYIFYCVRCRFVMSYSNRTVTLRPKCCSIKVDGILMQVGELQTFVCLFVWDTMTASVWPPDPVRDHPFYIQDQCFK